MIDSNKIEINVDELMQKIREEAAKRKTDSQLLIFNPSNIPSNIELSTLNTTVNHIEALLVNAESRSIVRTKWPENLNRFPLNFSRGFQKITLKILNFIFKDQREVNFNVIHALRESILLNRQLITQVVHSRSHFDENLSVVDHRLQALDKNLSVVDHRLQTLDENLSVVDHRLRTLDDRLTHVESRLQALNQRLSHVESSIQNMDENLSLVNHNVQEIDGNFSKIDSRTNSSITNTQQRLDTMNNVIGAIADRFSAMDTRIHILDERSIKNESYLQNDLMQQKRLITMFLEEAHKSLPKPFHQEQLQTFINENQHSLDAFYAAFEDQFRGSREDILSKLKVYLPIIEEAKVGTPESPILDVGCGRGEWLELLRESGYTARGLDINRVMLDQCQARGLEVIESDVIAYLQSLPDASLGALTAFHIVEHLPLEKLINLLDETVRVVKPGGLVIYETPNPQNVQVGSHLFYMDPTHRNPLPSSMLKFMAENRGLHSVKVLNLNPFSDEFRIFGSEVAEQFSDYFYGPQDYAIIGFKR